MSAKNKQVNAVAHDPKLVFKHALYFLGTDTFLRETVDVDARMKPMIENPGMVLSSFASELFFKCLILIEKGTPNPTHNLLTLYGQLSPNGKILVERHWDEGCLKRKHLIDAQEKKVKTAIPRDLITALTDCGDAFKLIRYRYEGKKAPMFYITHLPISLRKAIQEITGWRPRF